MKDSTTRAGRRVGTSSKRRRPGDANLAFRRRWRERHAEMVLVVGLFRVLCIDWALSGEEATEAQWFALFRGVWGSGPGVRQMERELQEAGEGEGEEGAGIFAPLVLREVTRWMCSIDLPSDLPHLLLDPPVLERRGGAPS